MQVRCEICDKFINSALHTNMPGASPYWKLNDFPDYAKGVIYFCGAEHATEYNQNLLSKDDV